MYRTLGKYGGRVIQTIRKIRQKTLRWAILISYVCAVCLISLSGLKKAEAANFTMQTGYYAGSGTAGLAISGLGFQPNFIMIKSQSSAVAAVFKTSAMAANTTAYTSATADDTGTNISFTTDGFTLGTLANVNSANTLYNWVAFGGSDCSATGNFCVGTYTGNGAASRVITTGFQPAVAIAKRSTAVAGHFRVASEAANETLFFNNTARDTAGNYIQSFAATSFTVGATDNVNTGVYNYVAFKATANAVSQGTFAGNGTDNRSITGLGYVPDFVMVKNATSATANNRRPNMNFTESYGDNSSFVGDAVVNAVNGIQALQADGFQVGNSGSVNENATTSYWFAFGGAATYSSSGSFSMNTGSYTGNGTSQSISGIGFQPDLVIIKAANATAGVFRTELMLGDSTAYLDSATANLTGAITSLNATGFSVGNSAQTNTSAVVYQWQAFGNAYNPYTNTGSNDFAVGAYYGNGIDSRDINRIPWQPDMVTIKRNGASAGTWRTSALVGDLSSFFGATAETANFVQALNSDGFQVGANAAVNTAAAVNYWFAFKSGANFAVGTYSGSGATQSVTSTGMRPENIWIKRSTAVNGVRRPVSLSGNASQYFVATANGTNHVTGFVKGGFSLTGTATETNASGGTYRYAVWNDSDYGTLITDVVNASGASVGSPTHALTTLPYSFDCMSRSGTLGTTTQRIRVSNFTTTPGWSLSIAPTSGTSELWRNVGDTQRYDFNDPSGSPAGCSDGGDSDSVGGQLRFDSSAGTLNAESGCSTSNVSLDGLTSFSQGITDSVELMSASSSANADCYFEITDISILQMIPREQAIDSYDINLTLTIVAN